MKYSVDVDHPSSGNPEIRISRETFISILQQVADGCFYTDRTVEDFSVDDERNVSFTMSDRIPEENTIDKYINPLKNTPSIPNVTPDLFGK